MTVDESDLAMIRPERRRGVSPWAAALAGLAVGAAAVGLAWSLTGAAGDVGSFTLTGTLTLSSGAQLGNSTTCVGSTGNDDIKAGTPVTVFDEAGKIVGVGALGAGQLQITGDNTALDAPCVFPVTVPGVSKGPKFYQVQISSRAKMTVPAADAEAGQFAATG